MKHIINLFLVAVCAATLLCSCSKAKSIMLSTDRVAFAITGGEKSITVTADGPYDIKDCPDWLKAEARESELVLTAEQNNTGAMRECAIKLVGDNIEVPVFVSQADKCTFITPSELEITFPKEGGTKEITIDTDGASVAVNNADFLTPVEGEPCLEGRVEGDRLIITCPANDFGTKKGNLTLTCDDITNTVAITIEGSICPRCDGTGKIKCSKCGGRGMFMNDSGFAYTVIACTKCGGRGSYTDAGYGGGSHPGYSKGSGKMTCPDCGGAGH